MEDDTGERGVKSKQSNSSGGSVYKISYANPCKRWFYASKSVAASHHVEAACGAKNPVSLDFPCVPRALLNLGLGEEGK